MTTYEKLLSAANRTDAIVSFEPCRVSPSYSLRVDGYSSIFFDEKRLPSSAEKTAAFAHELGHCETGSFYNVNTPLETKGRQEYRANKWAVQKVIPWTKLRIALRQTTALWELAEHFEVTEDFVLTAIDVYRRQGKLL